VADSPGCLPPIEPTDDPALRARLASAHVAVIGCGGLGSNVAAILLRSGVGTLTLIDHDLVEESNLNRQLFFRDQLGKAKVDALAETLRRIDPEATLHLVRQCVTAENLAAMVRGADIVIEAVDRSETKAMIVNRVLDELPGTPLVGASGLAGIDSANAVVTEKVADDFYLTGDLVSDVREGHPLLASRVMVAAAHQAHMAIRILLGHATP
jgi:sulfur carrier protein ThiS adenylyltransferase